MKTDPTNNPESPPALTVIAGPNGSGKSTLTQWLREQGVDFGDYINPDEIAKELEGSYEERVRAAQRLADQRREDCIREKRDFSFETVMSHPSKLDIMRRAKEAGFHVTLYFVGTDDPDINVARVRNRVALGGHDVPEDRIRQRYQRAMAALFEAVMIADASVVFDSSLIFSDIKPILRVNSLIFSGIKPILRVSHENGQPVLRSKFCRRRANDEFEIDPAFPSWVVEHVLQPLQRSVQSFHIA